MNAPVKALDFTNVKREPLSQSTAREHRIGMPILRQHRSEELAVLDRHRLERACASRKAARRNRHAQLRHPIEMSANAPIIYPQFTIGPGNWSAKTAMRRASA